MGYWCGIYGSAQAANLVIRRVDALHTRISGNALRLSNLFTKMVKRFTKKTGGRKGLPSCVQVNADNNNNNNNSSKRSNVLFGRLARPFG